MLDIEEAAIRTYDAKAGKFLVIVNNKNGYHLECTTNRLARLPLIGRIVTWYYEKKLPAVVQYLLSDVSGFEGIKIQELRNKVKATIDRFFASQAHNQSELHQRTFDAYKRAFVDIGIAQPEQVHVAAPEPTPAEKHAKWVQDFEHNHCVLEPVVKELFANGLQIEPAFAEDLQKLLMRLPNLHFYFTWPLGQRPTPSPEGFIEAVKAGPSNAVWVQVAAFGGPFQMFASPTFEIIENHPIFSMNLGKVKNGLGYTQQEINKKSFEKFVAQTYDHKLLEKVAESTKAIQEMS